MVHDKMDQLESAIENLRRTLDGAEVGRTTQWADDLHEVLAQVTAAIGTEVPASKETMDNVGDANPNFQNVPGAERHVQKTRKKLIRLGERAHQLRNEIRQANNSQAADPAVLRRQALEIVEGLEAVRKDDDGFLLEHLNSNPGSGE